MPITNTCYEIWRDICRFGGCAEAGYSDHQGCTRAISARGGDHFGDVWRDRSVAEIRHARRAGKVDSLPEAESTLREKHFSAADALIKDEKLA